VFAKLLSEPLYALLREHIAAIESSLGLEIATFSETLDDLPDLSEMDEDIQCCLVFDDQIYADKASLERVSSYFTIARKKNCTCVFLSQKNTRVPALIRRNSTDVFLFYTNNRKERADLYQEYGTDLSQDQFNKLFALTRGKTPCGLANSVRIRVNEPDLNKKYLLNISEPVSLDGFS
jgi:hypothetical protein